MKREQCRCARCETTFMARSYPSKVRFCSENCRKRYHENHRRAPCPGCGKPMAPGSEYPSHAPGLCRACRDEKRHRASELRHARIAEMWLDGEPLWAIARDLGSTTNAIGVEMVRMRKTGWALPLRSPRARKRMGPTDVRGLRDQISLARLRPYQRAGSAVYLAIQRGVLERPDRCERCGGGEKIEGHHADYSKPLEVEWLCFTCHRQQHNQLLEEQQAA